MNAGRISLERCAATAGATSPLAADTNYHAVAHIEYAAQTLDQCINGVLATTSHELRAPLTSLSCSLQLADKYLHHPEQAPSGEQSSVSIARLLSMAMHQVNRMTRLIDDLNDSVAIQHGTMTLRFETHNLVHLVTNAVIERRLLHPERIFNLQVHGHTTIPIMGDADRIQQVLTNYLVNAVKFTQDEQPIEIHLRVTDSTVRVLVIDQGPGLLPGQHERIWHRFEQGTSKPGTSCSVDGLGLGLHICQAVIERHHGHVGVESDQGKGATFWFELPLQ